MFGGVAPSRLEMRRRKNETRKQTAGQENKQTRRKSFFPILTPRGDYSGTMVSRLEVRGWQPLVICPSVSLDVVDLHVVSGSDWSLQIGLGAAQALAAASMY